MVSVDDMPELFVSFESECRVFIIFIKICFVFSILTILTKIFYSTELIPRPVHTFEEPPPLYLRLRMGKPKDKKIPKSTPIMSYGKKKMKPEYWFSVPRNR